jgi:hypothetical protein
MDLLPQAGREALATSVNLTEARANLLRLDAARLDLQANLERVKLEEQRVLVELAKNGEALDRQRAVVKGFEDKLASYTLKLT